MQLRDLRDTGRDVAAVVELEEEVARDPEGDEVQRDPADDLVCAQVNREEGVHESEAAAGERSDHETPHPAAELVRPPDAPERPHEHHSLESDVHDAGPL